MKFYFTQELKNEILKTLDSLEKSLELNIKTNVIYTNEARFGKNFIIQRNTGFIFNGSELHGNKFVFELSPITINRKIYDNYMNGLVKLNRSFDNKTWANIGTNSECHDLNTIFAHMFTYWSLRYYLVSDMELRDNIKKETFIKNGEPFTTYDLNFDKMDEDIINKRDEKFKLVIPTIKILMNNSNPNEFKMDWHSFKSTIQSMPTDEQFDMERKQFNNVISYLLGDLTNWTDAMAEVYGYAD